MDQNLWLDAQDMVSEWTTNNKIAQQTTQQTWSDLSQWTSLSSHWSGLTLGALLLLHYHTTDSSHSHDHDTECRHGHAELRLLIRGANIIVSKCCFKASPSCSSSCSTTIRKTTTAASDMSIKRFFLLVLCCCYCFTTNVLFWHTQTHTKLILRSKTTTVLGKCCLWNKSSICCIVLSTAWEILWGILRALNMPDDQGC